MTKIAERDNEPLLALSSELSGCLTHGIVLEWCHIDLNIAHSAYRGNNVFDPEDGILSHVFC